MIEITQKELEERLNSRTSSPKIIRGQTTGNGSYTFHDNKNEEGKTIIPQEANGLVSALVALEGRGGQKKVANLFNVGQDKISNIVNGKNWDGEKRDHLVSKAKDGRQAASDLALTKLQESLGLITNDRVSALPIQEIVDISQKMSVIVRNISGDQNKAPQIGQVVLLAPSIKEESRYDVMTIEAQAV
jgi:hypothetical protein